MPAHRVFRSGDLKSSLQACDDLGSGTYGRVIKVYNTRYGCAAAKVFSVTGTVERQRGTTHAIVESEANIMALASHENVVRFYGICCWSHYYALIMEYETGGSLHDLLKNDQVSLLPWKLRLRFVYETVKAIVFLHNSGLDERIVHGDLKSSNILLSESLHVRVGDFGAATLATKTCDQTSPRHDSKSRQHTVVFSAPEFLSDVFGVRHPDMDIYSLGRVTYELLTRETPFYDATFQDITNEIVHGAVPSDTKINQIRAEMVANADEDLVILDFFRQLMASCCTISRSRRPGILIVQQNIRNLIETVSSTVMAKAVLVVVNQMNTQRNESEPEVRKPLTDLVI
ncbi:uncharacterized protein LOC143465016 [Clavelina lepadiformis]|uniref:uncharacterized protein LOC143465016 n=1 Tax=Clavelina lepadiformis TaxID=159417 RepID=UPI0040426F5B